MFDFSQHTDRLCRDIVARTPRLTHVDMDRVAVTVARCRRHTPHGLQAKLTPLRFPGGRRTGTRGGRRVRMQTVRLDGREMLYLLTFYLPRFLDRPAEDALLTVFHELYHISDAFDGDLRRLPGRNYAHSHSRQRYDAHMAELVAAYLSAKPDPALRAFLSIAFKELEARFGGVCGMRVQVPRLIPVEGEM